jgi:hypothetical protein|tara:strand:+ start:581 stop:784 length:204 start_codon:yes stop_codon:yes gene_type:complete
MQIDVGKEYKRSHLHDAFGGNRQGGIASYAKADIVFLFCGLPSFARALAVSPLAATLFETKAPICNP